MVIAIFYSSHAYYLSFVQGVCTGDESDPGVSNLEEDVLINWEIY